MPDEVSVAIPVILGVVELAKRVGLPSRYLPVVGVLLGLALSLYTGDSLFTGLVNALSAMGVYSGVKSVIGK